MEDGSNGILPDTDEKIQNGVVSPIVANFPITTTTTTTTTEDATISAIIEAKINDDLTITKINGDRNVDKIDQIGDDYDCNSSDASDALVIDESIPKQQKTKRKRNKKPIKPTINENTEHSHYNPYFNESLFELSQQHLTTATGTVLTTTTTTTAATISPIELTTINSVGVYEKTDNFGQKQQQTNLNKSHKHKRLKKSSPKLREYTQYLGLQPSVQFKCSKCTRTGFQSLNLLNEHLVQCNAEPILQQPTTNDNNQALSSSFKLTRKVFLCSACGTYYENWNLYLHMIEVHRRYLCLYCLGMFSVLDDLCTHIQIKHNLEPGYKENLQEFFNTYSDPCYIVCCNCGKLFNEQENFFYHSCTNIETTNNNRVGKSLNKTKQSPIIKQHEQHLTGDSIINQSSQQIDEIKLDDVINNEISTTNQEILYSSDSDTDLKGFDSNGEAVVIDRSKFEEKIDKPIIEQQQQQQQDDDEQGDDEASEESGNDEEIEQIETRKVPKLSLKLKLGSYPEIEQHSYHDDDEDEDENQENSNDDEDDDKDSDKDECGENEEQSEIVDKRDEETEVEKVEEIQIAGPEIPIIELQLEQPLDKFDIRLLLQKCLNATAPTCIYCNHARKINVNGKRLGLHAIAQHRYSAIVSSITAEELIPESFVTRIKENLTNLDSIYFNLESNPTQIDGGVTFSHIFECFQCRYSTTIHKELYLHNRKSHTKNLLLCIMCKLNFYSYSELICHLCPGAYIIDYDVQFRCCMCVSDDIPSAFRLMVHLRKRHHCCDVCLEMCHNQYKLSNHVWKHKLHHFCYRCGIAYRNKPDITRHLFWKHGTESVVCKKCLQKKWPHVYHFCVPPNHFQCDECNLTLTRAVALKVHKRIHTNEKPHSCTVDDCQERFISKKLLAKHELRHREPPPPPPLLEETPQIVQQKDEEDDEEIRVDDEINDKQENKDEKIDEEKEKPIQKPKIDVYDLPELNLSESDSSDSDVETEKKTNDNNGENIEKIVENPIVDNNSDDGENRETVVENCNNDNEIPILEETNDDTNINQDVVIENIWDNFKNYQANKEKFDHLLTEVESKFDQQQQQQQQNDQHEQPEQQDNKNQEPLTLEMALLDHDYCIDPDNKPDISFTEVKPDLSQSVDHDYCFGKNSNTTQDKNDDKVDNNETKVEKIDTTVKIDENIKNSAQKQSNSSSSDSSSDSDSSSCSCGPNCSCSSSSDSSSSSSDSSDSDSSTEEGRKRQQLRRDKRRQRANTKHNNNKIDAKNDDNKIVDIISTATTTTTTAATTNTNLLLSEISIHESDLETTESETDEEFYDKQPHLMAKKILEEKRNQLLAGIEAITTPNGSLLEQPSRSTTPNLPVEVEQQQQDETTVVRSKKKSKSKKKKKKKKSENSKEMNIPNTNFYQYYQTAGPVTLNSPIQSPNSLSTISLKNHYEQQQQQRGSDDDASLRASKRRRVPNKFYGYSSDEDEATKWRKTDLPQITQQQQTPPPPPQQFVVPPITIKTQGTQPFSVSKSTPNQMKFHSKQQYYQQFQQQQQQQRMPPIRLKQPKNHHKFDDNNGGGGGESEQESTDSASGESRNLLKVNPSALYCYCKCPYDEVSEMIGCDAPDCKIEWFHFECVGIMVPPKGHWYCPECRKKRQQKREALKLKAKQQQQSPA